MYTRYVPLRKIYPKLNADIDKLVKDYRKEVLDKRKQRQKIIAPNVDVCKKGSGAGNIA